MLKSILVTEKAKAETKNIKSVDTKKFTLNTKNDNDNEKLNDALDVLRENKATLLRTNAAGVGIPHNYDTESVFNDKKSLEAMALYLNNLDKVGFEDKEKYFSSLNKEQIDLFTTLVAGEKYDAAYNYITGIESDIYNQFLEGEAKWAKEHEVLASVKSVATNFADSVAYPIKLFSDNKSLDVNSDLTSTYRETVTQEIEEGKTGKVGSYIYQGVMGLADMGVALAAGYAFGGGATQAAKTITQVIMSSSAASSTLTDARKRGLDNAQAISLSIAAGAIEAITEKLSIEAVFSKPTSAAKYLAQNFFAEASEEMAAEVANNIVDMMISGDKSQLQLRVKQLVSEGETEENANKIAWQEHFAAVGEAGIIGGITGGMMGVGGAVTIGRNNFALSRKGAELIKLGTNRTHMLRFAEAINSTLKSKELTTAIDNYNKKNSNYNTGKLDYEIKQAIAKSFDGATTPEQITGVAGQLYTLAETHKMSNIYDKMIEESASYTAGINAKDNPEQFKEVVSEANGENDVLDEVDNENTELSPEMAHYRGIVLQEGANDTAEQNTEATLEDTFSGFAVDYNTLDDNKKQVVDAAKSRGKEVVFFDIPKELAEFGGYYGNDGRIYISNRYGGELSTLVHELTHVAEASSLYTDFKEKVLSSMQFETWLNKLGTTKQQFVEEYINSAKAINKGAGSEVLKTDSDTAESEMIAKFCGEVLFTESGAKALMADTSLTNSEKKGIIRVILDFFKKIKARLSSRMKREIIELERLYTEMLDTLDGTETEGQGKAEIVTLDNGMQYVQATREQVIKGDNPEEWGKQVTNYINNVIRENKDITVKTTYGDYLTITRDTAGKGGFRNEVKTPDGAYRLLDDSEYETKLNAEIHIDELAEVSLKYRKEPTPDDKNHNFAKDGFIYPTTYFRDYDGEYYRVTISVGLNGNISTVYNVGKMKKDTLPVGKNSNYMGSKADNVSKYSIPNSSENVNTNNKNNSSGQGKALLIDDAMYEDVKRQEQIDEDNALFKSVTQEDLVTLLGLSEESPQKVKRRALKSAVDRFLKENNASLGTEEKEILYEQFSTIANAINNQDADGIGNIFKKTVEEISDSIYGNIEWGTKRTAKADAFYKRIKEIGGIKLTQAQKNEIAEAYGSYGEWYKKYGKGIISNTGNNLEVLSEFGLMQFSEGATEISTAKEFVELLEYYANLTENAEPYTNEEKEAIKQTIYYDVAVLLQSIDMGESTTTEKKNALQ